MQRLMTLVLPWFGAVILVFLPGMAVSEQRRVALIIGNSDYAHVSSLPNPENDATDMSDALKRLGFKVSLGNNLDYNAMRLIVRDFGETAADADVALVYFAGHGIEIDSVNYLIPVNAQLKSDRDVDFEALRLDAVMGAIEGSKGVKIILVDACRNNPFVADMTRTVATRSIGKGLSRVDSGAVLVGYSARGGTVSLDGKGRNSPYAKALLDHIEEPGLEIGKMFRMVRDQVLETTDGDQEPFTYGSLPGEDIFLVPPLELASASVPPGAPAIPTISKEEEQFEAAKRLGTPRAWALYFRNYPNGRFAREALDLEDMALGFVIEAFAEADDSIIIPTRQFRNAPYDPEKVTPEVAAKVDDWLGVSPSETFAIQALLQRIGLYNEGVIDGQIGGKSRAALREFQKSRGLPAHGIVTRATMVALGLPPTLDGEDVRPNKSSTYPSPQWAMALEQLGEDPRVVKAAKGYLGDKQVTYGLFGGHVYFAVKNDWKLSTYNLKTFLNEIARLGADLASITSKDENDFVVELIRHDTGFWTYSDYGWVAGPNIGLIQQDGASEPRGGWAWVSGEAVNYLNWAPSKPDNEDRANLAEFGHQHPQGAGRGKRNWAGWGDYRKPRGAYVLEIE